MHGRVSNLRMRNSLASLTASSSVNAAWTPEHWSTVIDAQPTARTFPRMMRWRSFAAACRAKHWWAPLSAVLLSGSALAAAPPAPQEDPELRTVVQQAITEAQCFADKY